MAAVRIVTHDGIFHCDEVVAVAIVRLLYRLGGKEVTVVRTRDPKAFRGDDIIVDVGGWLGLGDARGGRALFLDHHQRGGAGAREGNGVPFASAGLVWGWNFGNDLLRMLFPDAKYEDIVKVLLQVDREFIAPIDAADNGHPLATGWTCDIRPLTLGGIISSFNPSWQDEGTDADAAFDAAVEYATTALLAAVRRAYGNALAIGLVQAALKCRTDPRLLVLERFCPWQEAMFSPEGQEVLFVVFRQSGETGKWVVYAVPARPASFGNRKDLPDAWGGLEAAELQKITGVADAIFCHPGRFICGAGSKEGALRLAKLALAE